MYAKPSPFRTRTAQSPRAARTAARIEAEFLDLLATKPYEQISMAELADRCGIARSTVYRKWPGLEGLLWSTLRTALEGMVKRALAYDVEAALTSLRTVWSVPGLIPALRDPSACSHVRRNLGLLIASEIERQDARRNAEASGLMIATSALAVLVQKANEPHLPDDALEDLVFLIYVSAFMTPRALKAAAQERGRTKARGAFPPAVSIRESLASDEHILSMIDGRPYRSLKRHLTRFNMTPDDYRQCFQLPDDYPMVAPAYSKRRRALATSSLRAARKQNEEAQAFA